MRVFIGGVLALSAVTADASRLRDVRVWDGPDSTRVVLDLGPTKDEGYKVFTLSQPDRVVIDLPSVSETPALDQPFSSKGVVHDIRSGPHEHGTRIVLDVARAVTPKVFGMPPSGDYGYRLILDLAPPSDAAAPSAAPAPGNAADKTPEAAPAAAKASATVAVAAANAANAGAAPSPSPVVTATPPAVVPAVAPSPASASVQPAKLSTPSPAVELREKPIVVAVDAGHGGEDPGAHGPHGLLEKDVTLSVARRLAHLIDAQPGMRAVLTRDGDYYIGLRERTMKARKAQADLFVSVHCNALLNPSMRGTAVYVLSDHGASNEQARWLASHENSADLVGGVNLQDKDDQLAAVLIDISQTATMEASFDLANRMLDSLGKINVLQKPDVQQAGFIVLKSPDIPSVLVETAFITNQHEEKLLGDASYQGRLADSMLDGIRGYFSNYRPLQQVAVNPAPHVQRVSLQQNPAPRHGTRSERLRKN